MMARTLSIENRWDNDNGRAARASIVSPPSGTFLTFNNWGNAGDAMGKARGRVEDGGFANAGLDGLLMPSPSAMLSVAASAASPSSAVANLSYSFVCDLGTSRSFGRFFGG